MRHKQSQSFYIVYIWGCTPDPVPKADIKTKKYYGIYAVILSEGNFPNPFRESLRPLRRVAARALERFAFCATSLRFTSFIFGACVLRAPSEPASAASVVKNPASNSRLKKPFSIRRFYPIFYHLSPMGTVPKTIFFFLRTIQKKSPTSIKTANP